MPNSSSNGTTLVSVCGKGGTGKTVITALMTQSLIQSGRAGKLLIIDADPALGQLSALGANVQRTMGQVREEIIQTAKKGGKEAKRELAEKVDYMVFEALCEMDDFAVLAMGRTESMGCYCPVNSLLRQAITTLSKSFDTILIDGEAGLEQINRQVTRHLDTLMIISDPSARGMETAAVIKSMVEQDKLIRCDKLGIIFNRVMGNEDLLRESAGKIGVDVLGLVPLDEKIAAHDLVGKPITELPLDSVGPAAVREIVEEYVLH